MYPEFAGKVVVVTGGGAGIGRAIALRFGKEGATVVVNDLHLEAAQKVADEIRAAGGKADAIAGDMTKGADVDHLFDQVFAKHDNVYVLVNNVGLFTYSSVVGSSEEEWDRIMNLNVKSAFLCSRRVADRMLKAGVGRIINMSSGAGKLGGTGNGAYRAAKAAVLGLTRTLAAELAPAVRVNAVCPGIIEGTDMDRAHTAKLQAKTGTSVEDYNKSRLARIVLKRFGTPEDVAKAVAFLASDEASYTTGEAMNVSGGLVMH